MPPPPGPSAPTPGQCRVPLRSWWARLNASSLPTTETVNNGSGTGQLASMMLLFVSILVIFIFIFAIPTSQISNVSLVFFKYIYLEIGKSSTSYSCLISVLNPNRVSTTEKMCFQSFSMIRQSQNLVKQNILVTSVQSPFAIYTLSLLKHISLQFKALYSL